MDNCENCQFSRHNPTRLAKDDTEEYIICSKDSRTLPVTHICDKHILKD